MTAGTKYLTIEQAAEHLGMSVSWMRLHRDELPVKKFFGVLRYTAEDLDRWAAER